MSIRAQWGLADLSVPPVDQDDPFAGDIQDIGRPIDVQKDRAELRADLESLIGKEMRLAETQDITCEIKDQGGHKCSPVCPQYTKSEHDPKSVLCRTGCDQYDILASLDRLDGDEQATLAVA